MKFCPYCGKELNGNHCDCEGYKINILSEIEAEEPSKVEEACKVEEVNTENKEVAKETTEEVKEEPNVQNSTPVIKEGDKFDINKIFNFLINGITKPFSGINKINNIGLINLFVVMALLSIISGVGTVLFVKNLASSVLSKVFDYSFYGMSMDLTNVISLKGLYVSIPIITFVILLALAGVIYVLPVIFKNSKVEFKDALSIVVYPFILPVVIGVGALIISLLNGVAAVVVFAFNICIAIYLLYGSIVNNIEVGRSKALYIFAVAGAILLCIYGALFYKQILSAVQDAVNSGIDSFFDGLF